MTNLLPRFKGYKRYIFIIFFTLIIIILSFINFYNSKNTALHSIQDKNIVLLNGVLQYVENYICERMCDLEDLQYYNANDINELYIHTNYLFNRHDRYDSISLVDADGNYLFTLPDDNYTYYDNIQKYFIEAKTKNTSIISDVYKTDNNKLLISIITPIYIENSISAFMIGNVKCENIGEEIIYPHFRNTENTVFGIDKNGVRIFTLNKQYLGTNSFSTLNNNKIALNNYKNMSKGNTILGEHLSQFDHTNYESILKTTKKRLIVSKPLIIHDQFKFSIAITTPNSVTNFFESFILRQLIVFVLLIIISLFIAYFLFKDYIEKLSLRENLYDSKESERIKTEFFCTMSHELRTPLTVIISATHLLYTKYRFIAEKNENLNKLFLRIKQNSFRLLKITNNLLDISKMDSDYFEINLSNINIINFIEEITLSVTPYTQLKNIDLIFDTQIEEKIIAIDQNEIEKLLLNLLSNAIKFTPANGKIEVKISTDKKFVIISVKDNGIGISKDYQEYIFYRFSQGDKSLKRNNEGTGLGLSIVKSIVNKHKGKIELISEESKGSEFIIYLPDITVESNSSVEKIENSKSFINQIDIEFSDVQ